MTEQDWVATWTELRRIYDHRVAEVRDQQSRVGSILTANGLVLAFAAVRPALPGILGLLQAQALALLAAAILFGPSCLMAPNSAWNSDVP